MSEIGTVTILLGALAAGALSSLQTTGRSRSGRSRKRRSPRERAGYHERSDARRRRHGEGTSFRRRVHEERVRAKTEQFLRKYESILADLQAQGLDRYVAGEIAEAEQRLAAVRRLLPHDPFGARALNMEIGPFVGGLPGIARRRRAQERAARRAETSATRRPKRSRPESGPSRESEQHEPLQAGAPIESAADTQDQLRERLREALDVAIERDFTDQVLLDFAYDELRTLRDEIEQLELTSARDVDRWQRAFASRLAGIRQRAQQAAEQWRARYERPAELMFVEEEIKDLESSLSPAADPAATKVLDDLKALRDAIRSGALSGEALSAKLVERLEAAEEVVVTEECRREVVRALSAALQQQGFVVEPPRRTKVGNTDQVVITARKPAGQSARVSVTKTGDVHYKFLNYTGMECKKDIDRVLELLQSAYNIPLGERRVIWQNPDRISKEARPLPGSAQSRGGSK